MEVKVGQVYKWLYGNFIVTDTSKSDDGTEFYCFINSDGTAGSLPQDFIKKSIEGGFKLLAEYPTWREAVNSKEFKGV